jgi:hypothetical protein
MNNRMLSIDHEIMSGVKSVLDGAILQTAMDVGEMEQATITLKIVIAQFVPEEPDDTRKNLMPIDYSCNVVTKRSVYSEKGMTDMAVIERDRYTGELVAKYAGQVSIMEMVEDMTDVVEDVSCD